jgi:uncharacterized protein YggL (DUF469 family)
MSAACPILGFAAEFQLRAHLEASIVAVVRDAFHTEVLVPRGLISRGVQREARWSCVVRAEAGQATAADREVVLAWARTRPEIVNTEVGQIVDLTDT